MKRFALGIAAGAFAVFGGLATAYGALATVWPDSLPAPAISRLVHIDEKLRFIRVHPGLDPEILAVGSSITWRQIDGRAFAGGDDGGFLNGGTGLLNIHQTRDLLEFYLDRFAQVDTVLVMTGPPDFSDCTRQPAALLDHGDAAAYAFEGWPEAYFYLRYFAPQRYLRTALSLAERREPLRGDLYLDTYGSGPLEIPETMQRGLRYGAIRLDPACTAAMVELSHRMTERALHLVVVFAPIHPDYRREHPDVVDQLDDAAHEVEAATAGDDTEIIRLDASEAFAPDDFYDAFHLQWPAVQRLSGMVASAMTAAPGEIPQDRMPPMASDKGRDQTAAVPPKR